MHCRGGSGVVGYCFQAVNERCFWLLPKKRQQQHRFMEKLLRHQPRASKDKWAPRLQRHQALQEKLAASPPSAATFRGIEGSAGRIFYLLAGQSLPERYRFARRSLRPAQDSFNSFLNYAYAVLYGRVEEALLRAGLSPYLGLMHRDGYRFKSLVYDFIEPFRVKTIAWATRLRLDTRCLPLFSRTSTPLVSLSAVQP
ncbi:MAG: CRISPR-associated endonuclease Cas1 [Lewinellaceae bacterium]|nr:CRISPR-associated endonuclease Cas1 [Lewinellaceae bacterium]